jgi:hypothetical protein
MSSTFKGIRAISEPAAFAGDSKGLNMEGRLPSSVLTSTEWRRGRLPCVQRGLLSGSL